MTETEVIWKPIPKQAEFLSIPDSVFEGMYGGAAGGGKTDCLLLLPLVRGFYKHPKFKGIIFRRTYPELEKEVIVRSQYWYKMTGAKYSDEKKRWTFPSGAIMQFGHVEYEADVRKYDSAEYNYMAFDELTSFTEFQYLYLSISRARSGTPELPVIIRSGTNPGNIGHGWVRKRFVEAAPYGTILQWMPPGATKPLKRIFIQATVDDNPHIDEDYKNRLALLPEAERRAKRDGDWWTFSGQVFDEWRENRFLDEPENAVHVVQPFEVPSWWPRILAIDWGFAAMTCALWGAVSPDLRLYVYREFTVKATKISSWATEIGKLSTGEELADVVLCKSAWQNRGEEMLIADQMFKYSGLRAREADNARIAGKNLLQEYLRWRPLQERKIIKPEEYDSALAESILRKHGTDQYKKYLSSFEPSKPETNLPKLQIFNTCKEVINCIPLCVYAPKDKDGKEREDVAEFPGDDPYDTARYLIQAADLRMRANDENDYRLKIAAIVAQLQKTGDQTTFYRQMATTRKVKSGPIRRFHDRRVA